jgi:hypothetical protein
VCHSRIKNYPHIRSHQIEYPTGIDTHTRIAIITLCLSFSHSDTVQRAINLNWVSMVPRIPGPTQPKSRGHLFSYKTTHPHPPCFSPGQSSSPASPIARGRNSLQIPGTSIAAVARGNPIPAPPSYRPRAAPSR